MDNRIVLNREGLRGALEVRSRAGISKSDPICAYDLAELLGVEVKFCGGKSLGGMYAKASKTILIPSLRPSGRQSFTCAHELGHWFFGHGTRVDDLDDIDKIAKSNDEEWLVNIFAGYLLMPPWAVKEAFERRNWRPLSCTPLEAYVISKQLGVGYETLVQHLRWSLRLITAAHFEKLLCQTPKKLRQEVLGKNIVNNLIIVDRAWIKVPIDLCVGDVVILPPDTTLEGKSVSIIGTHELGLLGEARYPGISRVASGPSWATFIRVSKKDFEGRSIYRHMEDPDVYEST